MSDEWGPVYSGVMTDCIEATRPAHDRMLALPYFEEYGIWLSGTFDDAASFQSGCFPDELIEMTRIDEFWVKCRVIPDTEAVVIRGRSDPPRSEMVQLITGEFEGKTKTHIEILQCSSRADGLCCLLERADAVPTRQRFTGQNALTAFRRCATDPRN